MGAVPASVRWAAARSPLRTAPVHAAEARPLSPEQARSLGGGAGLSHRAVAGERVRQTSIPPGEGVVGGRKNLRPWASPGGTFVRVPTLNAPHDTMVSQI